MSRRQRLHAWGQMALKTPNTSTTTNMDVHTVPTAPSSPSSFSLGKTVVASWLGHADVVKYRANYRNFRVGKAAGARGDVSDVGFTRFQASICPAAKEHDDSACDPVTRWRLAYRRYRLGAAHGAKGSEDAIASRIDSIDLLPIVQAFNLRRRLVRSKPVAASSSDTRSPLHVHFGGGKLGIGLILPALVASCTPFVIVQSNRGVYAGLNETISILVNEDTVCSMHVLYIDETAVIDDPSSLIDNALRHAAATSCKGVLLLSPRGAASGIKEYLYTQRATSFSCAVGPGLTSLGDDLRNVRFAAPLFACENDHAGVSKLSEALTTCGSSVKVIPCMVDRICTRLEQKSPSELSAGTEPFPGEIVLLENSDTTETLPLSGPTVKVPQIDAQAKYFAERKFLLVNGGHTVLAFLTLLRHSQDASPWTPPGHFRLLDWTTMDDQERSIFWSFAIARLLLLTWEYDTEVLKNAHGATSDEELCDELLRYARDGIHRFSAVPDYTSRILAAGVDNRYLGRLKNILDFLEVSNPASQGVGSMLLKRANVTYCGVVAMVHRLVQEAYQFTRNIELSFGVSLI